MKHYGFICVCVMALVLTGCGSAEFSSHNDSSNGEEVSQASDIVGGDLEQAAKSACDNKKIAICHVPEGNPENRRTLCLPPPAIEAHLLEHNASSAAGDEDYLGRCQDHFGSNSALVRDSEL